jgi:hypothetical protein
MVIERGDPGCRVLGLVIDELLSGQKLLLVELSDDAFFILRLRTSAINNSQRGKSGKESKTLGKALDPKGSVEG